MIDLRVTAKGAVMGFVDAVPGVSGGTMALILGIYERFIAALADIKDWPNRLRGWLTDDVRFLAALGLGLVPGLYLGARVLTHALDAAPMLMSSLFLALILASVPSVLRKADPSWAGFGVASAAALLAWGITILEPAGAPPLWRLPFYGALAVCAMMLPGISGSFVLLLLGAYAMVLQGIASLDVVILALLALGALVGVVVASTGLRWLLQHHAGRTHAAMVGLLIGSSGRLWPWRTEVGFAEGAPAAPFTFGLAQVALGGLAGVVLGVSFARLAENG